jgi:hypothetical protein
VESKRVLDVTLGCFASRSRPRSWQGRRWRCVSRDDRALLLPGLAGRRRRRPLPRLKVRTMQAGSEVGVTVARDPRSRDRAHLLHHCGSTSSPADQRRARRDAARGCTARGSPLRRPVRPALPARLRQAEDAGLAQAQSSPTKRICWLALTPSGVSRRSCPQAQARCRCLDRRSTLLEPSGSCSGRSRPCCAEAYP